VTKTLEYVVLKVKPIFQSMVLLSDEIRAQSVMKFFQPKKFQYSILFIQVWNF